MDKLTVKKFMEIFKEDIHVLINSEPCLSQLYNGVVKDVPEALYNMEVRSKCFDFEGEEPMIALLVY